VLAAAIGRLGTTTLYNTTRTSATVAVRFKAKNRLVVKLTE
jgi:hypothetical protein